MDRPTAERRFLQVADVAEVLGTTGQHVLQMLRNGQIRGIQIGGRGQWRVEDVELDAYIERRYAERDRQSVEVASDD